MLTFVLWLLLLVVAWPLALVALLLYPIVWLVSLPLRLVGISVKATIDLFGLLIRLPGRVHGVRARWGEATEPSEARRIHAPGPFGPRSERSSRSGWRPRSRGDR